MSREILFRGMTEDGEWVEGFYYMNPNSNLHPQYNKHWIKDSRGSDGVAFNYEVKPETVGQYSGIKDENGKKIFEGDIIQDEEHFYYTVSWSDNNLSWMIDGENLIDFKDCGIEIIGNIHQ